MSRDVSTYWSETHSPLYSFIFTMPLFVLYEIGTIFLSAEDIVVLRNGADVLMKQVLGLFGIFGVYGFSASFMVGFTIAFLRQKKSLKTLVVKGEYLLTMFFECIIYSAILFVLLGFFQTLLMSPPSKGILQQVVLSLGAGIYEEFVFRVILITGIASILGFIFQWHRQARYTGAVVLAAAVFSLFHFVGNFGDLFSIELFFIRFIAGIILGIIYAARGFGIAAYSHAFYDLIVLTILSTQ
ncbi:MAG: type II CAAX prenyl endopeptidase Rce1 family protein [Fidelibacterota bacterium]